MAPSPAPAVNEDEELIHLLTVNGEQPVVDVDWQQYLTCKPHHHVHSRITSFIYAEVFLV